MDNLIFDFELGKVYRKVKKYNTYEVCGTKHHKGYIRITINYKNFLLHRILYEKYHEVKLKPGEEIDHINQIKDDNRIINLRIASHSQNNQNSKSSNKLSEKYIYKNKYGYQVKIQSQKFKTIYKHFKTLDKAIVWRDCQIQYLNQEFDCFLNI